MTSSITLVRTLTQNNPYLIYPFEINPVFLDDGTQRNKTLGLRWTTTLAKAWFYPVDQVAALLHRRHTRQASAEVRIRIKNFFYENLLQNAKTRQTIATDLTRWRYYANKSIQLYA